MPNDMSNVHPLKDAVLVNGKPVLFEEIDGDFALITSNGVFTQAQLARRNGELYAKHGAGYIRLKAHGSTSKAKVFWRELLTTKVWKSSFHGLELV